MTVTVLPGSLPRLSAVVLMLMLAPSCGRESMAPDAALAPVSSVAGPAGTIAYHASGTGSLLPVVLVHSLAGSMNQWRAQVSHLTGSRRVVAIDLRGHGRSDPPSDGLYTPEAMSEDVSAVTTALGMPRFVLAGHSYGGSVAIAVAGMHPGEVGGLFLVDANGDLRSLANDQLDALITKLRSPEYEPIISAQWDRVLQGATPDTRRAVLEDLKHTPKAAVVSAFEAMRTFDPLSHLEDYSGPRFAVTTSFNDGNTALHRHVLLDHRLVVDTSHWPHMDKPSALNGLLDEFLGRVDRREARATPPAN